MVITFPTLVLHNNESYANFETTLEVKKWYNTVKIDLFTFNKVQTKLSLYYQQRQNENLTNKHIQPPDDLFCF